MIRNILNSIPGVEVFPIISLLLLVALFSTVVYLVVRMDKSRVKYYSRLPLDDNRSVENNRRDREDYNG